MQSWTWSHRASQAEQVTVYPDGCRDILIAFRPGQPPKVTLTRLDLRPRRVLLTAQTLLTGHRLEPGAAVTPVQLQAIAADPDRLADVLAESARPNAVGQAIRALARPATTVTSAAHGEGVSVRSLQRLFQRHGLPAPDFWRLLARTRHAAALLAGPLPIAAIAADCGFTDQPHLTRAFRYWFQLTPGQARRRPDLLAVIGQPGLGA